MDPSAAPGDDFYAYAYGGFMKTAELPPGHSSLGAMRNVADLVETQLRSLLESAEAQPLDVRTDRGKVLALYQSFMNEATIEARGLSPLKSQLDAIAKLKDRASLSTMLGSLVRADADGENPTRTSRPIALWVEQDLNEPSRNAAYLIQGGLGLPDRAYYFEGGKFEGHRRAYEAYLARLFQLSGDDEPTATAKSARVLAFEVKLARTHASRADSIDFEKGNNPVTRAELEAKAKGMDWAAFLSAAGLHKQPAFVLWQPSAILGLSALVASEPMATWKEYLTARALDRFAPVLPKAFADASFAFYRTKLAGVARRPERWKEGLAALNQSLAMELGHMYADRYFRPEMRVEIDAMVENIRAAFERRIDGLEWMSGDAKAHAKAKLRSLRVSIGHPDTWRDVSGLTITPDDVFGNLERASLYRYQQKLRSLGAPPDRSEWCLPPQSASACNATIRRSIALPAGFLQPPVYDTGTTTAVRYGAYGSMIGHELSHAFDSTGSAFDEEGRFRSSWSATDREHLQASAQKLVEQLNQYRPFPDVALNGALTLRESLADLVGLSVAFDAWSASLGGSEAPRVDGLTGAQQFFIAFAQRRGTKETEASLRGRLPSAQHAPGPWGALTVRNVDAWYTAFDVHEGQALFLRPQDRVRMW
jgi:putative endopeptidase